MSTYVISDLHGYSFNKLMKLLEKPGFDSDDKLYILGDAIDRGDDGLEIIKWAAASANVTLIRGNHENLMLSCESLFSDEGLKPLGKMRETDLRLFNKWNDVGGEKTIYQLSRLHHSEVRKIFDYLYSTPLYMDIKVGGQRYILLHSGIGNFEKDKPLSGYTEKELLNARPSRSDRYYDNATTVFGHTPTVAFGPEYNGKIVCTETWVDIDSGVVFGNSPILLRLDDFVQFKND